MFCKDIFHQLSMTVQFVATPEVIIIIIIIFICSDKNTWCKQKEMIKPEQDSKVEKTTLTAALE